MSHLKTDGRRTLFVCHLSLLAAALLSAASDYGQTAATGATTNAKTSPLPGRQIWVVGDKGFIAHTEDSGVTWKKQSSGTQTDFYSVCFFNSQSGWAVGHSTFIVHTEDGGRSWQPQETGIHAPITVLHATTFVSAQSGWAVGYPDLILHTDDGGHSWRNQYHGSSSVLPHEFKAVTFLTPQSGWIVGYGGLILHTEDSGRTWQQQPSGTDTALDSVAFNTPKSG